MHARRVVITGMGAVTPLGQSVERFYAAACEGANGVVRGSRMVFDAHIISTTFAAEVKDYDSASILARCRSAGNTAGVNTSLHGGRSRQP